MSIAESDVAVPTRPIAFGDVFFTSRMSEVELENARRLPTKVPPALMPLTAEWQQEALKLAQAPHVIAANAGLGNFRSLGKKSLDSILRIVSQQVFDEDSDMQRFLDVGAPLFSVFDQISIGLGSVPFVGSALNVIVSVVKMIMARGPVPLPPQLKMDPANDEREVNQALSMVRSMGDWTPLFLPHPGELSDDYGGWRMAQEEGGYRFGTGSGGGFGCAPGDLYYVAKGVQARIGSGDVALPGGKKPRHREFLTQGNNRNLLRTRVFSIGEWYPGLASLGRSVWSMVGTSDSTAMFQVDPLALITAWTKYSAALGKFRSSMDVWLGRRIGRKRSGPKRRLIAAYLSNVGAAFHDARMGDGSPLSTQQLLELALDANRRPLPETVGEQAVRASASLSRRQWAASGTTLNALVSKNAPALLARADLRDHFLRERKQLLDAGRFNHVDLSEVPDEILRQAIEERRRRGSAFGGPTEFVDAAATERDRRDREGWEDERRKIPTPPGMTGFGVPDEPDVTGGGNSMLAATLVAAAGLGGTAVYLRSRSKSRRSRVG